MAKFCTNCGAALEAATKFCTQCGARVATGAPLATPQAPLMSGQSALASSQPARGQQPGFTPAVDALMHQPPAPAAQPFSSWPAERATVAAPSSPSRAALSWSVLAFLILALAGGALFLMRPQRVLSDQDVVKTIQSKFYDDPNLRKCTIEVSAANGVVTLVGLVNADTDNENAVDIARRQQGVSQVVSHLVLSVEQTPDTMQFPVGRAPSGIAFDGTNIWVANGHDDTVTKLRPSDGANLGTFTVGSEPEGLAFDGADIWVANYGGGGGTTVTKLRASDGTNLGTFSVGGAPTGVTFDGANIWVTNYGAAATGNTVTKLRASDGTNLGTFTAGSAPHALALDGSNIWVTNTGPNWSGNTVTKLRASDGTIRGTFTVGTGPNAVAFDGSNIWVTNSGSNNVSKLRASDGAALGTFPVGNWPAGVACDGANIWVANEHSDNVTVLRASDGARLSTFSVGSKPYGAAFDGANIWVTNYGSNTVSKLRTPPLNAHPAPTVSPRVPGGNPPSGRDRSAGSTRTIVVPGNQAWTPTGFNLGAGDAVEISASGNVSMGAGWPPMPPTGRPPDCGGRGGFPAPGLPCWSLIGRIGEQGIMFYVGSRITFRAPTSGQLFLGVNDNVLGDNSGGWTATVLVKPALVSTPNSQDPR